LSVVAWAAAVVCAGRGDCQRLCCFLTLFFADRMTEHKTRMAAGRKAVLLPDTVRIGQRLRERRRALRLTQEELVERAGLSRPTLMRWEKGEIPRSIATRRLQLLEAALQVPQGWLLGHDAEPVPSAVSGLGIAMLPIEAHTGHVNRQTGSAMDIGRQAARLRMELGLEVPEVANACHQLSATLREWEQGTFRVALTGERLRAWETALRLAPGQLLAPPASHPLVHRGRWHVVIEAQTVEMSIHRVAQCLATRGRNLIQPLQPLKPRAERDAALLAHRYTSDRHRQPLIDVAVLHGITLNHAHQTIARMIERAALFEFDIPVLAPFLLAGEEGAQPVIAISDGCTKAQLGPTLRVRDVARFVREILVAAKVRARTADATRSLVKAGRNGYRGPGDARGRVTG
jgi:transcriptional regulator with XRE-family HTH domain